MEEVRRAVGKRDQADHFGVVADGRGFAFGTCRDREGTIADASFDFSRAACSIFAARRLHLILTSWSFATCACWRPCAAIGGCRRAQRAASADPRPADCNQRPARPSGTRQEYRAGPRPARCRRARSRWPAVAPPHLATLVRRLRSEQPASVFVSSGDLIGASPLISGLFYDEPTIEVMNEMGLEANALGNHEFDRGVQGTAAHRRWRLPCRADADRSSCAGLSGAYAGARFPFPRRQCARPRWPPLVPPTWIKTIGDVKIGFIGAVTRATPAIVMPSGIEGLRSSSRKRARSTSRPPRSRRNGVHAIVALVHEGGETDGGINECINPRGPMFRH
jgi:hypothetical protein